MIATIINAVAIVIGGLLGLIIKGRFNKKLQAIASQATGLSVLVVGLNTDLTQLITQPCNSVLFVISLVVGGLIGTVINVEGRLQALGRWVEKKVGGRKGGVSRAFVTATLLYCVGSMAVVGSIESGLHHNYSILLTKAYGYDICCYNCLNSWLWCYIFSCKCFYISGSYYSACRCCRTLSYRRYNERDCPCRWCAYNRAWD